MRYHRPVRCLAHRAASALKANPLTDVLDNARFPRAASRRRRTATIAAANRRNLVGPYELHDFFLYYIAVGGAFSPKQDFPAWHSARSTGVYAERYHSDKWLRTFYAAGSIAQPVQALVPAGWSEGRKRNAFAARRLAYAIRCGSSPDVRV